MKRTFKIVEKFKIFAPIALALIIVGAILMATIGLNIGLDFAGGTKLEIDLGEYVVTHQDVKTQAEAEIKKVIKDNGFEVNSSVQWAGDDKNVMEIGLASKHNGKEVDSSNTEEQTEFVNLIEGENGLNSKIVDALTALNEEIDVDIDSIKVRTVNPSTARRLLVNAIWATVAAIVVMLIYIIIRFTLSSGLAAITSLAHDVLVMFALMAIFQVKISTTFIAAIITIVGYSINATIVIFDRIRELKTMPSLQGESDATIANMAIKNTLGRTILTTLTTLLTIIALAVVCVAMGVTTMEEFALPIIFGLLAGTYSSVFLASSFWVGYRKLGAKIIKKK